jgi:protein-S-isoprenylcysteine O-methyltransferase Ste14
MLIERNIIDLSKDIFIFRFISYSKMKKLNSLGIGPKVAVVLLPWLAVSIIISSKYKGLFFYSRSGSNTILIIGIILMIIGLALYFSTVKLLLKGLRETKLVTNGAYSLCQNPLYSSLLLFVIPALSLILNSWLVLTSSVAGYILFSIFIRYEYNELESIFGEEYLKYKKQTPEFFPNPFKKN